MESYKVDATICLKDGLGLEYAVSSIQYTVWENEEFEYIFTPNYSVIDLLDSSLFQGIPGMDLNLKKEQYVRRNTVPTFISERAPSKNRQELWKLLEEQNMQYLNQLEWLINTDTKYIGDRLYVTKAITKNSKSPLNVDDNISQLKRPYDIQRLLLTNICHGFDIIYDGLEINDTNRKTCYDLLYRLFKLESKRIKTAQAIGISKAKGNNTYQGRKAIYVDDLKLNEIWQKYKSKKITAQEAASLLNISVSTFYRRIKKFEDNI